MPDVLLTSFRNVPEGTSAGLKVDNAVKYVNQVVNDGDLASAATILTYNPPSGSTALVFGMSVFSTSGPADTAVLDVEVVTASVTITVAQFAFGDMDTLTAYQPISVTLADGDELRLTVSTVDAAETADLGVYAVEIAA